MATKKATIKRKISAIEFSKEQMRKAINSKGRDIKKNAAFSTYGEEIRQIVSGDMVEDLGSITITKNGTTNPGTNKGYSSVEVSVSGNVQPYGETVTKNGTISASGDIDGYSSITVQVAGGKETDPEIIRKNAHGLGRKTITKNGVYRAEDEGYKGYSEVNVQVIKKGDEDKEDTGKTYTVTFKNKDGTTLQTVENVPFGGAAAYTGEEPTLESMDKIGYWYGWKPIPYDIRKDTTCTALYSDFNCGYKDPDEIKDNWDKICSNRGTKYRVGQWRLLCFGETEFGTTLSDAQNQTIELPLSGIQNGIAYYRDESPHKAVYKFGMTRMMLVAKDESGTNSTWVSIDRPPFIIGDGTVKDSKYDFNNYDKSIIRDFYNNQAIKAFPKCLQNSILEVTKYSSGFITENDDRQWVQNMETQDKIWMLSRREVFGNTGEVAKYETNGEHYSILQKYLKSMSYLFGTKESDYGATNGSAVRLRSWHKDGSITTGPSFAGNVPLYNGAAHIGDQAILWQNSGIWRVDFKNAGKEGTSAILASTGALTMGFCL